jgi:hypothetical protein
MGLPFSSPRSLARKRVSYPVQRLAPILKGMDGGPKQLVSATIKARATMPSRNHAGRLRILNVLCCPLKWFSIGLADLTGNDEPAGEGQIQVWFFCTGKCSSMGRSDSCG